MAAAKKKPAKKPAKPSRIAIAKAAVIPRLEPEIPASGPFPTEDETRVVGDVALLSGPPPNPDTIRMLSMRFIEKRLAGSMVSEEIRIQALSGLQQKLKNTDEVTMDRLLRVVSLLGEQGSMDMAAIIAATKDSGVPGKKTTNIFNIGGGQASDEAAHKGVSPAGLALLGDLLQISEAITSKLDR